MIGHLRNLVLGAGMVVYLLRERLRTGRWRTAARIRNGRIGAVPRRASGPRILVHGVSVGENHALVPLIEELAGVPANPDLVVSASTRTGFARACEIHRGRHAVVRFPLDFTWMVNRFLDDLGPNLVVLAELELWPNFLAGCARRGIPVCVVNGRMSERSFRGYRRGRWLTFGSLRRLTLVAAQSEEYRARFAALGVPAERCRVTGSLKWDAAHATPDPEAAAQLARTLGIDRSRPLIVAGSTGPGEEEALLAALPAGCQLLVAPRDPARWDAVAALHPDTVRRSETDGEERGRAQSVSFFLLDSLGELSTAYAIADLVFIGRSLIPRGGSNPLEAVALGKPTVIGPHHENFAAIVAHLVDAGGIVVSDRPMEVMEEWLRDGEAAEEVGRAGAGTVERERGVARRTAELVMGVAVAATDADDADGA